ncbi:MAG: WD40 repeat domain-containing protein, partial [Anaerolineae bacterium]
IESAAPDTLATRRVIWRSSEPLAAGVVALGGQSAAVVTTGHRLHSVALPAGEQPGRSLQLPAAAAGLSLDPAGKTIALCLRNRQGLLIALADGRIVHRWEWGFPAAAFNPAGDAAAFVDAAGMIRLYRLDPLAEITRFDLQREAVSALAFSAGGGELWAAGKKFLRWQINSARRLPSLPGIKEGAAVFALSPHGDGLLAGNDREVVFWAADGRRKLGSVRLAGVRAACFAAPALAALVQPGGAVQMCRLPNRRIVAARPFDSFACAALSPDGQLILTGDGRGVVKGWRAESGEPVFAWQSNHKPVSAIAMHPFKPLAAVATSKTLWYLDLAGPQPQPAGERQSDGPAGRLAFSSDGRRLLLQKPGRAWLIDPADHRAKPLPLKADAAAFAADNQILATVRKGKLTWVDAASGQQRPTAAVPPARDLAFNGTGSLLAIAAQEGGVSLWNKAGKRIFNLQNVEASLQDLTFAPDDLLLTAIDSAGRLAFWDAAIAARQAAIPAHNGPARIAGYSQNGHTLVTAGRDGLVRWWQA